MKLKPYLDKVSGEYITEGLTPQDGADSISDFDAKFSFASFTWNGDDKTGAKCAKQTKKQIKQYIQTKIEEAEKRGYAKGISDHSKRVEDLISQAKKEALEEALKGINKEIKKEKDWDVITGMSYSKQIIQSLIKKYE